MNKIINTTVSTGTKLRLMHNGEPTSTTGEVGTYKQGKIRILWYASPTSGFSEFVTTRELNNRLKNNTIKIEP